MVYRFLRRLLVCNAQIFVPIFSFWRLKNMCSRVTQKSAQNLRQTPRRLNVGSPLHVLSLQQTACHTIAARPMHPRRACERPLWHLGATRPAFVCSNILKVELCGKSALRPTASKVLLLGLKEGHNSDAGDTTSIQKQHDHKERDRYTY